MKTDFRVGFLLVYVIPLLNNFILMRIIFFILMIFIASCGYQDKTPEGIIPKEKMVDILVDVHLTDGLFTNNSTRIRYAKQDSINYYDRILENHGYTRKDFDTSVYYYSHNINEYNKIYIEVLNKLSEKETRVKEEMQEAPDSLEKR
ncbi:MAG: DUF4296 domain-containing protein [Bacteroidales bacterium]|nr:DUF4296 domain-containing protein [Bacteroidales bacterium]